MTELITQQLDYILFLGGLGYFILAYAAFSISSNASPMPWRWIGFAALLQSLGLWAGVVALVNWLEWAFAVQTILCCLGLCCLVEFGRRLSGWDRLAWHGLWLYPLLAAPAITVAFFNASLIVVTLKALLGAGVFITFVPGLRSISHNPQLLDKRYVVSCAIYLTVIIIIQPITAYLLAEVHNHPADNQGATLWLELLLALEIVFVVLLSFEFRSIYNAYKRRSLDISFGRGRLRWVIVIVLAGIAFGGFVITVLLTSTWEQEIKQEFITQTRVAALGVNPERIKSMTGTPGDLATADYQRLYDQQVLINQANEANRWTYLLIMREGRLLILTDSEPLTSPEHTALIEYTDAPPEVTPVFASGKSAVIGPYSDQWGRWITALVPVKDSRSGEIVAVQGTDISAAKYYELLAMKRLMAISSIWFFALFAMGYYYFERRLREQLAILEKSETRYSAMVENALDGILILQDGKVKYINSSAARIFDRRRDELTGHRVTEFIVEDDHATVISRLADRMAGKMISNFTPLRVVRPNGEIRYIEATGALIEYEDRPADMAQIRDITERRLAEEALKHNSHRMESIINSLPEATFVIDGERKVIAWNKAMELMTGTKKDDLLNKGDYEYSVAMYGIRRPALIDVVFTQGEEGMQRYEGVYRDGDNAFAEAFVPLAYGGKGAYMWGSASLLRDDEGNITGAIETIRDITYRKDLEQELQASNEKLKEWLGEAENRSQAIILIGEMVQWIDSCDSIKEASKVAGRYLQQLFKGDNGFLAFVDPDRGILEADVIFGNPAGDLYFNADECWGIRMGKLHACGGTDNCQTCRHLGNHFSGAYIEVPLTAQGHPLGLLCIQHAAATGFDSKESEIWLATKKEIAARAAEPLSLSLANTRLRSTLREQANRDPLTGLYNRRFMEDALERELHRAEREKMDIGFIMGDIDHFKTFNDKYGHEAGDIMLKTVAATIRASIRVEDIACRFGGEEFLIILPSASLTDTQERAGQIHKKVKQISFEYGGHHICNVSISMGISAFPEYGDNPSALIAAADMAMYNAKRQGRDRVCLPI